MPGLIRAVLLVVAAFLAACAPQLQSQVEAFSAADAIRPTDRIFVFPAVEPGRETLEHRTWVQLAEAEFRKRGFGVAASPGEATAFAAVGLSIDTGRDVTSSFAIPQFGVTGYSGSNTFGTVNRFGSMATVNATTTYVPQYGVTGYVPGSRTDRVFRRIGHLAIYRPSSTSADQQRPVFESRALSEGSCGMLSAVAPNLVDALFATFPSGGTRRVASDISNRC